MPEVTCCQVRRAIDALLEARDMPPCVRAEKLAAAAKHAQTTQQRIAKARFYARRVRIRLLNSRGYYLTGMRSCIIVQRE